VNLCWKIEVNFIIMKSKSNHWLQMKMIFLGWKKRLELISNFMIEVFIELIHHYGRAKCFSLSMCVKFLQNIDMNVHEKC
jgi:hypothetical protein